MDKVIAEKVSRRETFMRDHRLKYLEFEALVPNKLARLREAIEALPNGENKSVSREIIFWIRDQFQEVLKDYHALQEGSQLRNVLDDHVATQKVNDNSRGSVKENSRPLR